MSGTSAPPLVPFTVVYPADATARASGYARNWSIPLPRVGSYQVTLYGSLLQNNQTESFTAITIHQGNAAGAVKGGSALCIHPDGAGNGAPLAYSGVFTLSEAAMTIQITLYAGGATSTVAADSLFVNVTYLG